MGLLMEMRLFDTPSNSASTPSTSSSHRRSDVQGKPLDLVLVADAHGALQRVSARIRRDDLLVPQLFLSVRLPGPNAEAIQAATMSGKAFASATADVPGSAAIASSM